MKQRWLLSRGQDLKIAKQTWIDATHEETIVKVITDGLNACRIPNIRIRERIPKCHQCHAFIGQPGKKGIPDVLFWMPMFYQSTAMRVPATNPLAHFGAFEVKRPKGGIEAIEQQEMLKAIRHAGGISAFTRSWDEAKAAIEAAGYRLPI